MKVLFSLLAAIAALTLVPLSDADAGVCPTYRLIGHTPCGKPIYTYFRVQGYDSAGQPVGCWVEQYPSSCRCHLQRPACEAGHQGNIGLGSGSGSNFSFRIPR